MKIRFATINTPDCFFNPRPVPTGTLILFNSAKVPVYTKVSVPLVIGMGVFLGGTFFAVVLIAVRAMKTPVHTGSEAMTGRTGFAVTDINPSGIAQVAGEQWSAKLKEGAGAVLSGERVEVIRTEGVKVVVRKGESYQILHQPILLN